MGGTTIVLNTLTDRVVALRPFRTEDALPMHAAVRESLADLKPWMSWARDDYSEREAHDWVALARARWNDNLHFSFAISEPKTGEFLGACSLSHLHPVYHFCNLGYWVRTSRRGQGNRRPGGAHGSTLCLRAPWTAACRNRRGDG